MGPEAGQQKIRAWGPGLEGGTVGLAASFVVEATGVEAGMLGEVKITVNVILPSMLQIQGTHI